MDIAIKLGKPNCGLIFIIRPNIGKNRKELFNFHPTEDIKGMKRLLSG